LEKDEAPTIGAPPSLADAAALIPEDVIEELPIPTSPTGDAWMRAVHAAGRERGLDHEAIRRIAADLFEWDPDSPHSLTDLSPLQRGALRSAVNERPVIESDTGSSGGEAVSEGVSAVGSDNHSSEQPAPSDFETKLWNAAATHGIRGWPAIDDVFRAAFPGADPETFDMGGPEWETVLGEIEEGIHDG